MTTDRFSFLRRPALSLAAGLAVVAALAWLVLAGGTAKRTEGERWVAVRAAPLVHQIGLVGRLEPGRVVTLAAPFAGNVEALLVEPGQRVAEGQELLRMDTREIAVQVREAQSALLKARRTLQDLRDWERGEDMARVRRALRSAQLAQSSTERKVARDPRAVPARDRPAQRTRRSRTTGQPAAHGPGGGPAGSGVDPRQGQGENRQIAEMDLANASVKYETLRAQLDGRTVRAPFAGIVVAAPGLAGEQGSREPVQAGSKLGQGQALFGLASVERLKVSAKVSELDINQLREGQAVEISGDGFEGTTLAGVIAALGGQALPGMAQGGSPQFEVTVSVAPLDPRQLQKIRLGMSAKLTVTTYRNEQAIVVPPEAIRHEGDRLFVDFRQAPGASVMAQQVKIGRSTPEGVEVFELQPGLVRVPSSSDR
ncbi:transporter [Pseudomonas aeruginosa]|nr:transporter [Pseudomonas aeruginosa]